MLGKKFGRLLVMAYDKTDKHRMAHWLCKCDCGKVVVVRGLSLRTGHTKSCGCARKGHGLSRTKTYYTWVDMRRRCLQKHNYQYPKYGGRGISVCNRWFSFYKFLEDMGVRPEGTSLDRIDGKKGYSKKNCRWATPREQIINRSITRWIEFKGERLCLQDWANRIGISSFALGWRIDKGKWPLKEALTQPPNSGVSLEER